jgi:hypothetical protein
MCLWIFGQGWPEPNMGLTHTTACNCCNYTRIQLWPILFNTNFREAKQKREERHMHGGHCAPQPLPLAHWKRISWCHALSDAFKANHTLANNTLAI